MKRRKGLIQSSCYYYTCITAAKSTNALTKFHKHTRVASSQWLSSHECSPQIHPGQGSTTDGGGGNDGGLTQPSGAQSLSGKH